MKYVHKLLLISLATLLLTCKDDANDDRCHQYFLVKEKYTNKKGSQFFYNSDGLLSALYYAPYNQARIEFVYDENKKLTKVNDYDTHLTISFPDANSVCMVKYNSFLAEKTDSIVVAYDDKGRVSTRTQYSGYGDPWSAVEYDTAVYVGSDTAKIFHYNSNQELSLKETYIIDNHPTPYPKEYNYFLLSLGSVVVSGNIRSYTYEDELLYTYNYDYNADGYPTRYSTNGVYLSSYVYSCEPVHE